MKIKDLASGAVTLLGFFCACLYNDYLPTLFYEFLTGREKLSSFYTKKLDNGYKLGLTTQISNTIQIGKNDIRPRFQRGRYTITFIRQKNKITNDNIFLLQILDAIRYIKKIPDAPFLSSLERLLIIIKDLPIPDKKKMVSLLLKYPASTRALVGAMLEQLKSIELAEKLRNTLNPVTVYKMPAVSKIIANAENWNIK